MYEQYFTWGNGEPTEESWRGGEGGEGGRVVTLISKLPCLVVGVQQVKAELSVIVIQLGCLLYQHVYCHASRTRYRWGSC